MLEWQKLKQKLAEIDKLAVTEVERELGVYVISNKLSATLHCQAAAKKHHKC